MRIDGRRRSDFVMLGVGALLAGCTSLSGVGGDAHYACPAPQGVQCGSVTANYQQSSHRDLPARGPTEPVALVPESANTPTVTTARLANADGDSGTPLHSSPRILTLWVAPWEDRDNVLHDAAFVHVPIDHGHWLIDLVRPLNRPESRPLRLPPRDASAVPANTDTLPRSSSPAETEDGDAR
jgi:conjugal transfer pilus assembly protein TraV